METYNLTYFSVASFSREQHAAPFRSPIEDPLHVIALSHPKPFAMNNRNTPPSNQQGNSIPNQFNSSSSIVRPTSHAPQQQTSHNGIPGAHSPSRQGYVLGQNGAPHHTHSQQVGISHGVQANQQLQHSHAQASMQQQPLLSNSHNRHVPQQARVSYGQPVAIPNQIGLQSAPTASYSQVSNSQRQQQSQQSPNWNVPNPLGVHSQPSQHQTQLHPIQQPHQQPRLVQPAFHRPPNAPQAASIPQVRNQGVTVVQQPSDQKPKVILSTEAKQALAKAIWSAIRSPTGNIDPNFMQAAVATGLPEHAVRNAARVAREREAQKRQQHQQLSQQHQVAHQQQMAQQQKQQQIAQQQKQLAHQQKQQQLAQQQKQQQVAQQQKQQQVAQQQQIARQQQMLAQQEKMIHQQQKQIHQKQMQQKQKLQQQQQLEMQRQKALQEHQHQQQVKIQKKIAERSNWKRALSGVFVTNKKGSFHTIQNSVVALIKNADIIPVLKSDYAIESEAINIQRSLLKKRTSSVIDNIDASIEKHVTLHESEKFKRMKIEPKKFARLFDKTARKARQSVADTISKQYKELTKSIISHQNEFYKFHRQRRMDSYRIAKSIRDSFEKEEKKRGKDAIVQERARLAALKANDMTAYSKLLEETRNDRLKFLLEKTEKHFTEISTLLQDRPEQQNFTLGSAPPKAATSYYASAHKLAEEVRQPSLLVGGDLKEYQLAGLHWMVSLYNNKLNGILADEMGLGKTIQAISLIAYLMEFKQNLGPYLVIVPLSTLSNWQNEFAKWCPSARTVCYKGTPTQRRDIFKDYIRAGHFNVLLTTYEYIIRDKKNLRPIIWQYAIVDEGHRMKNAGSKFAVTLGKEYTTKFRILLTGTPLMNDLSELWSLLNFLLPTIFNSVSTFDQWFKTPFEQFSGSNNDDSEQELLTNEERVLVIHRLHELVRPFMLRRVKSEVLDQLPEKVEKVLRCELSSWQKELYRQISKKAVAENGLLNNSTAAAVPTRGLNNVVMQLRKVCNHPYLFSPEGYHVNENIIRSSAKVALLDEMLPKLKAAGHRVLMFTQMTAVMNILEDFFALRGFRSLRLDGSTTAEEREKRMYQYNAPDSPCFIFLLSTRAGGLGLNLVSGDTVILFDSDWNPAMDLQAQDRAHRIGQRSDVSVFRLVTYSPVEEKILSRATEKLNVSQLVVESGKFNKDSVDSDNSLERKRLMEVLLTDFDSALPKSAVDKAGSDDEDEDAGSETNEKEDLNELLSNNEADFQLYSEFDKKMEAEGTGPAPLFTSPSDVPDWILHPKVTGSQSVFKAATDDSRKRNDVAYDDGLTEKQFMRMMDKQAIQEENVKKKQKKGRGRPPSKIETLEEDEPLDESPSGSSLLTDWTYRKLISCGKAVLSLKDPSTKRRLSEIFLEKPDPATFPDYYEIIEKPIAINDILRKCRAKIYDSISEFKDDWKLMFNNAVKFNGADSWVVQDANALEKELERTLKKNGFVDDLKPPTCKEKKPIPRIRITLKKK